ncbi:UNKNOWN [Stylonychia lemnae]|uniref:Uncharacterized protein n=1 Tax=Stylonychia lemnae TaxID=5949 RepID=A0A078BB03_STYLE|nr:UNKNOWN [Stylonychia lemnae]|eukprot:CDW90417.1 UNKNOWN [Stylonychia lemnae]
MSKVKNTVYNSLKSIDYFSKPINFTYKDTIVEVSNSYSDPHVIGEIGISIAFMLSDINGLLLLYEEEIGKFNLWQGKFDLVETPDGKITREFSRQLVPYNKCSVNSTALRKLSQQDILSYPIDDYYCPDLTNLTLQANFHAPQFQFLFLEFMKCKDKKLCQNSTLLKKRIESSNIQIIVVSSFFEVDNYEQPVKYFMDDAFYPMIDNMNLQATMLFRSSIQDSKFQLSMARNLFLIQDYKKLMNQNTLIVDDDDEDDQNLSKHQQKAKKVQRSILRLKENKKFQNLEFKYKDLFRAFMMDSYGWMINCCKKNDRSKLKIKRKHLLEKGKEKVVDELDCANILRKLRMVDNMAQLLLSVPQQILLYNQKKDVINMNESSEDEELMNLRNVRKITRNIKLFAAFAYYKLKDSLTTTDKRIIMGTVSNNPHFLDKEILESEINNKMKLMHQQSIRNKNIQKLEELDIYDNLQMEVQAFSKGKFQTFMSGKNKSNKSVSSYKTQRRGTGQNSKKLMPNFSFVNDLERQQSNLKTDSSVELEPLEQKQNKKRSSTTVLGLKKIFKDEESIQLYKEDISATELDDSSQFQQL